jgi:cytochrome P450
LDVAPPTSAAESGSTTAREPQHPAASVGRQRWSVGHGLRQLAHLPHCGHRPILADLRFLRDSLAFARDVHARCGPVSHGVLFARAQVLLMSAEANEAVLADREGAYCARGGWEPLLGRLFPGGLIMRDGDDHRRHRRWMLPALRREALARHIARMVPAIEAAADRWAAGPHLDVHAAIRELTLGIALETFLGVAPGSSARAIGADYEALVDASAAVLRLPLPGTRHARGRAARGRLEHFLHRLATERVRAPGQDLFSQLCVAAAQGGDAPTRAELVDHMVFLLMAAHDTTTSALVTTVASLAVEPQWQDRLADEIAQVAATASAASGDGEVAEVLRLDRLERCGWALREALRLYPPIPTLARSAAREVTLHGHRIPAGAPVTLFPLLVQRDPRWWTDPDRFDPLRFSPERAEHRRHPGIWTPFGGGAHMCLGMNFAELQSRAVLRALLRRVRWSCGPHDRYDHAFAPIGHPRGPFTLRLRAAHVPGADGEAGHAAPR